MLRPPNRKLIFVQPWLDGTANQTEALALDCANRLASAGAKVELWATTMGLDGDGRMNAEAYRPGESQRGSLLVRRFAAEPRDALIHEELRQKLLRSEELEQDQEELLFKNDIWSGTMRKAIHNSRGDSIFLFHPCVTATTVYGVAAAPLQSVILPDLTHRPMAKLHLVRQTIELCHNYLFPSEPEQWLSREIFDLDEKHCLAAAGIDGADDPRISSAAAMPAPVGKPYLVASADDPHSLPKLCEMIGKLVADTPLNWRLVLIGQHARQVPARYERVVHRVEEMDPRKRAALLANALCFVHTSEHEHVPPLMLEAWLRGCPALVHSGSAVVKAHVLLAGAGLYFDSYDEFRHAIMGLARQPKLSKELGEAGRNYVRRRFRWSLALERQIRFLREIEQWLDEVKTA